jgi:LmbE family N-acetylglucosaminyl deacetylase
MSMKLVAMTLALFLSTAATAQTQFTDPANLRGERPTPLTGRELPIDQGPTGLAQLLRKLNTRASILNIVAHPDDEDGGMLTLYARGLGARVTDLSLTRGEGGQNAVTGDFEDALGLLRTQELLSNDRYTGVTQMFGTEVDFGFSKTREEAFAKWTHDRVLYDAVRAIRLVRPLVITATFVGNVTDGHGQHQVSGQIAQEAFVAAADPNVFPDQIAEGLLPWQALKVYARVPFADINSNGVFDYATGQYVPARFTNYVTGKVTTAKPPADVDVPEGTDDPLLTIAAANPQDIPSNFAAHPDTALSYLQFGRIGLGLQRSQISRNMTLPVSGAYNSGYTLYGSVLCNAPADAKFLSPSSKSVILSEARSPQNAVILSEAKDPCIQPAAELPSASPNSNQTSSSRSFKGINDTHGVQPERSMQAPAPINNPSLTAQPNFFTGIDTSIESIATLLTNSPAFLHDGLRVTAESISKAQLAFSPSNPEACAPPLKDALETIDQLIKRINPINDIPADQKQNLLHELRIKRVQLNQALALSLGVSGRLDLAGIAQGSSAMEVIVPPVTLQASVTLHKTSQAPVALVGEGGPINLDASISGNLHQELKDSTESKIELHIEPIHPNAPADATHNQYFTRPNIEQPFYDLTRPQYRNAPEDPPFTYSAFFLYQKTRFASPLVVPRMASVPRVAVSLPAHATVFPSTATSLQIAIVVRSSIQTDTRGSLRLDLPPGWTSAPQSAPFDLSEAGSASAISFQITPAQFSPNGSYTIRAVATVNGQKFTEGYRPVGYPGLPYTNYYTPATTRIVPVDLKLPSHHHIAYLPGTGDAVPEALTSIGLAPTILTVSDLTPPNLAQYDTVILGVRTYNAHPDLHGAPTQALLDYAKNGGNVLVQYQTSEFTAADAPYPLSLGSAEKVVDETDAVELPDPHAALLTTPNQITPADFNNWIEERGHGFLSTWDPHYTPLTETHDPGGPETKPQLPQRGGLITTPLGKGRWTYVAFALYRQLPEAVPGAYRLFVNLLNP